MSARLYHSTPLQPPLPQAQSHFRLKHRIRRRIMQQYQVWEGVRYQWGGENMTGIDCSALIQKIFQNGFFVDLPRTTSGQIKQGYLVMLQDLLPGDLVFFRTRPDVRHVGVYVGTQHFIHASSSSGVTISSLENKYWKKRFETARRILE